MSLKRTPSYFSVEGPFKTEFRVCGNPTDVTFEAVI